MQVPNISISSDRPKVKRMSQRERQETQNSNDFDNPSAASTNRWSNRRQSHVAPEVINPWRPSQIPRTNPNDKCVLHRGWFWLFGGIFCLILIIAIVAVVLGIVLPMTTTTAPDGTATEKIAIVNPETSTSMICSNTDHGLIAILNGTTSSGWTSYSYNYLATKAAPTLLFGFKTDSTHMYYLDAVSVIDNNVSSIELLTNPSFEDSTISATGWFISCETTCTNQIISGSQCSESTGNCFMTNCTTNHSSIFFLGQSFMATIGNTYTISYMLNQVGNSDTGIVSFSLNII